MNKFIATGIITKDIDYRMTQSGDAWAKICIRVPSSVKDEQGRRKSDFFDLTAFKKTAENIQSFFVKGDTISVETSVRNHSYKKDGVMVYTNNFIIDRFYFIPTKKEDVEVPFQ